MIIKARPLVLLLTIGCAASAGCAVTTAPGDDMSQAGTGGGTPGVVSGTGGTPGVVGATGGAPGVVGATGGAPAVGATGGAPPVGATGGAGGTVVPGAYPGTVLANTISAAGYVTNTPWMGYAYTWKGAKGLATDVVNPATLTGDDLCAWGSLGLSYDSIIGLGMSVAEPVDHPMGTTKPTWDLSGSTGVSYSIQNDGGTPVRIQFNVGGTDYCYEVSTAKGLATGSATWDQFNSMCWDMSGTAMPATGPIEKFDVVAPGDLTVARSPAFCIGSIAPL